jgi:hypothetical protein
MARTKTATPPEPSAYELIGARLQRTINAPTAQREKAAVLYRAEGECEEAWGQVIDEISETDNVTVAHRDDGGVHVFWVVPKDD